MKQYELVWRQLLYMAIERDQRGTSLLALRDELGMSLSSLHQAIGRPREIGCLEVTSRGLTLLDPKRLLYLWAAHRRPARDELARVRVGMGSAALEAELGMAVIPTAYSAYSRAFGLTIADYDTVYGYVEPEDVVALLERLPPPQDRAAAGGAGLLTWTDISTPPATLVLLHQDRLMSRYPSLPIAQVFADLFNLPGWQTPRFMNAVERRILESLDELDQVV